MAELPLFNYDPNATQGLFGIDPMQYMLLPQYSAPPPMSGDLASLRSGQLGRDLDMQLLQMRQNASISKAAKAAYDADWEKKLAVSMAGAPAEPEVPSFDVPPMLTNDQMAMMGGLVKPVKKYRPSGGSASGGSALSGIVDYSANLAGSIFGGAGKKTGSMIAVKPPTPRPRDLASLGGKMFRNNASTNSFGGPSK